jgi:hypothetical protein
MGMGPCFSRAAMVSPSTSSIESARERVLVLQVAARSREHSRGPHDFLTISRELGQAYVKLGGGDRKDSGVCPGFFPELTFGDIVGKAAVNCPLIYLIDTTAGGMGLIVGTSEGVQTIWLPELTRRKLMDQVFQYFDAYSKMRAKTKSWKAWMNSLDEVLRWLWEAGLGSIVSALNGYREAVFVPGGLLGLLPLHAASPRFAAARAASVTSSRPHRYVGEEIRCMGAIASTPLKDAEANNVATSNRLFSWTSA